MVLNKNELNKYREAFVRIAKQNALKKMQYILMTKSTLLKEYSYTELRELYRLSHFTIKTSPYPKFLLDEAFKLDLLDGIVKKLLFSDDEDLIQLNEKTEGEVRELLDNAVREVL